jgi:zinc/manganese transport system permease protein
MNVSALVDPLFRLPFLTGLMFALALPVLGMYLRLREEWLAALAFAQVAAAGSLASSILGLPAQAGALSLTCGAAALKGWIARAGNNGYALLMIVGWACAILMLANVPIAEHLGHALFDGQLYFTGIGQLAVALLFLGATASLLPWLSRRLLLERMFPDFFGASGLSALRYHLIFDLLIAAGLALATSSIGVMASFGLVFVPSMIAYRVGPSWKTSVIIAGSFSLGAYLVAFGAALLFDQPFGPVLVITLATFAVSVWLVLLALQRRAPTGVTVSS